MSTTALEITPSSPVVQPGSIGGGTDNVPPTPTNPQLFFHSDAADVGSQASPAQPQAASREATANRAPVPIEPPALPQLPSISQARPPSLVPSDIISTRTRRRQAAAAGSPMPAVGYGFSRLNPAPPPTKEPVATARLPRRPRLPSPSRERPTRPTDLATAVSIRSAAAACSAASWRTKLGRHPGPPSRESNPSRARIL